MDVKLEPKPDVSLPPDPYELRTATPVGEAEVAVLVREQPGAWLSPINRRRWENFKANRRGYWSFWLFLVLFVMSLGAELIANDKPFLVKHEGSYYFPVFIDLCRDRLRGRVRNRRRLSRSLSAKADRREGRIHAVAADPLFLPHP